MHMHVDKTGGNQAPWQVLHGQARIARRQRCPGAHVLHHLSTAGIEAQHQQTIGLIDSGLPRVCGRVKAQQGGAVGLHGSMWLRQKIQTGHPAARHGRCAQGRR